MQQRTVRLELLAQSEALELARLKSSTEYDKNTNRLMTVKLESTEERLQQTGETQQHVARELHEEKQQIRRIMTEMRRECDQEKEKIRSQAAQSFGMSRLLVSRLLYTYFILFPRTVKSVFISGHRRTSTISTPSRVERSGDFADGNRWQRGGANSAH